MKNLIVILLIGIIFVPLAFADSQRVATDPSRIGVGARLLGMGKGYVALADDLSGIFINPAALAFVDNWQLTSMQGKFINEYDYLNFGSAWPTRFGTFGLGYVGSGISFTGPAVTQEVVDGIVRIIPSTTEGVTYSFTNQVMLLSWGNNLGTGVFRNFSLGATWKIFSLGLTGPGISNGTGVGHDLDWGLVFRPNSIFSLGLVRQNELSFEQGGRIEWANGTRETLRSTTKVGSSLNLIGANGLFSRDSHELTLNIDRDWFPKEEDTDSDVPALWHGGLEWYPLELIDFRFGVDQDFVGTGTGALEPANNLTYGLGLYFGSFRFDYAYHQYNSLSDNDTHYFSLSYGVENTRQRKKYNIKESALILFNLASREAVASQEIVLVDKAVVHSDSGVVMGTINDWRIKHIIVNGQKTELKSGKFQAKVKLNNGKNSIKLVGFDSRGKVVGSQTVRVLKMAKPIDVKEDYWAAKPIEQLSTLGILGLYEDQSFRPEGKVERIYLLMDALRAINAATAEVTDLPFNDIQGDEWFAPYVQAGYNKGIVKGYPDGRFEPREKTSRAEGIVMVVRLSDAPLRQTIDERPFDDIKARHWAIKEIAMAKQRSMLRFILENFDPEKKVSRAEIAATLSKNEIVKQKIDDLMDWEKGYDE